MHDYSLPTADRTDSPPATSQPLDRRPAIVVRLDTGVYFQRWATLGRYRCVRAMRHARLFISQAAAAQTIARLKRAGVDASAIDVTILIGVSPTLPY